MRQSTSQSDGTARRKARAAAFAFAVIALAAAGAQALEGVAVAALAGVDRWLAADTAAARRTAAAESPATTASRVLADDDFTASLRSEKFWSGRKSPSSSPWKGPGDGRSSLGAAPPAHPAAPTLSSRRPKADTEGEGTEDGSTWYAGSGETYRTMCVRLCDGYYWPVSFSVEEEAFERDQQTCERSCGSPARLFVYRNPGGSPETMEDTKGRAYSRLKTAFLFRTSYDAACTCRPQPWEKAATDQHRAYALAEQARKGNAKAAAELAGLRSEMVAEARTAGKAASRPAAEAELWTREPAAEKPSRPQRSAARTGRGGGADTAQQDQADEDLPGARPQRQAARPAAPPATVMRLGGSVPTSAPQKSTRKPSFGDWNSQILHSR